MVAPAIIALGGSLLYGDHDVKTWLGQLRQTIVHFEGNGRKIGLVVGGGKPAREGIQLAENLISDRYKLDEIGIAATRLNATILQTMLAEIGCNVANVVPTTTDQAAELFEAYDIVVMGGTKPGHTTDAVSVAFARDAGAAHVIIATNVSHVYTADPTRMPNPSKHSPLSNFRTLPAKKRLDLVKARPWTQLQSTGQSTAD